MNARQEHRYAHHDHEPQYGDTQRRGERFDEGGNAAESSSPYERAGRAGATQAANREAGWQGDERAAGDSQFSPNAAHTDFRGVGPKGYVRTDERIAEIVCDRLTEDASVDARDVCVTVNDGKVTLTGDVGSRAMKHRIEDIVDACGVKEIHNRLRVHPRGGD